jgi:hypothetical protein
LNESRPDRQTNKKESGQVRQINRQKTRKKETHTRRKIDRQTEEKDRQAEKLIERRKCRSK